MGVSCAIVAQHSPSAPVAAAHVGSAVGAPVGEPVVGSAVGAQVPPGTSANASSSKPAEEEDESDVSTTRRLVVLVLSTAGNVSPLKLPNTSPLLPSTILRKSRSASVANALKTIVIGPAEVMFHAHSMSSA
jgi:hypothetical protein